MRKPFNLLQATKEELNSALRDLEIAQLNFDNALPEFFNVANTELTIAQLKVDVLLTKAKMLSEQG